MSDHHTVFTEGSTPSIGFIYYRSRKRNYMGILADQIYKDIKQRVTSARNEAEVKGKADITSFYNQGSPQKYVRQGFYKNSFLMSSVSGGSKNFSFHMRLNIHEYTPSGRSGQEIFEAIQNNQLRILGKPRTWEQACKHLEESLNKHFS